jgi:hypothetical protein
MKRYELATRLAKRDPSFRKQWQSIRKKSKQDKITPEMEHEFREEVEALLKL